MALVWENLSFHGQDSFCQRQMQRCCGQSKKNLEKRKILSDVRGSLNFSEITALMGPSGAGKSTLLKCLTDGKNYRGVDGRIAVQSLLKMRAGYVTQNDREHLLLNLTVKEALYYASELKNSCSTTRKRRQTIVEDLLIEMDLVKVKKTYIAKCLGGQRKRIAVALEMTAKVYPNFLFLDEPTSGLDSQSAFNLVFRLRQLAINREMSVVAVIHQPSFEIFSLFHNVYILTKIGRCVFYGTPERLQEQLLEYKYFHSNSSNINPGDIIITIASSVSKENNTEDNLNNIELEAVSSIPTNTIKNTNEMKSDCEKMTIKLAEMWPETSYTMSGTEIQEHGLCSYSTKFNWYTLWVLIKRASVTSILRQKQLIFIRFALHAIVAGVLAALYDRNLGVVNCCLSTEFHHRNCSYVESEAKLQPESIPGENVKFQFFSLLFLIFAALMPTVLTFPAEIKLFINEHRNGWYNTSSYYISKSLVEIPYQLLFSVCYVYFLYWYSRQIGMEECYDGFYGYMSSKYANFLNVIIISCFIAQGLGFLIGIICVNSFSMAIIVSSTTLLFLFLFSGFFVKTIEMNPHTVWITDLSFIRLSFESLLIIIYGNKRCEFLPGTDIPSKSDILTNYDLHDEDLKTNFFWLVGHLIITRVLAFILLENLVNPKFIEMALKGSFLFKIVLPKLKQLICKIFCIITTIIAIIFSICLLFYTIVLISDRLKNK